jgi:hypothetical protein
MIYFAIYLDESFIGFISEESQKAFLLECDPNHEFYQFTWNEETPPYPWNVSLVDGELEVDATAQP